MKWVAVPTYLFLYIYTAYRHLYFWLMFIRIYTSSLPTCIVVCACWLIDSSVLVTHGLCVEDASKVKYTQCDVSMEGSMVYCMCCVVHVYLIMKLFTFVHDIVSLLLLLK